MVEMPISAVKRDGMVVDFAGYPKLVVDMLRALLSIQLELVRLDHDTSPPMFTLYTPWGYNSRFVRVFVCARAYPTIEIVGLRPERFVSASVASCLGRCETCILAYLPFQITFFRYEYYTKHT